MKKASIFIAACFAALLGLTSAANAALDGEFTITVTFGGTIQIALRTATDSGTYTSWAVGEQTANTSSTMTTAQAVFVKNTSDMPVNITAKASNTTAWTIGPVSDLNTFAVALSSGTALASLPAPSVALGSTAVTLAEGVAIGENRYILAKLICPQNIYHFSVEI